MLHRPGAGVFQRHDGADRDLRGRAADGGPLTKRILHRWPFLVLFAAVLFCLRQAPYGRVLNEGEGFNEMVPNGEAFLHHIPKIASFYRMPLGAIVMAWHHGHSPRWAKTLLQGALWTAPVFVAFQTGCLLQSPAAGALAALAAAAPLAINETGMGEELIYKLLLGLVAVLLLWRVARPDPGRSVVLGSAIALSLLCRSPLFLLPVLLTCYELRARRPEGRLGTSLALMAPSVLLLLPWVLLTWRLSGRFIPFENGRGNSNMTTGALGIVATIAGNYRELGGIPEGARILPWAVGQIIHHPLRYGAGCLGRLWFVFRLQPFLCLTAATSIWIHRRRQAYRQMGLFCAYFIGMHCLLSIEKRYLEPMWILLATLSLSGAVALLPSRKEPEPSVGLRWFFWPYLGAGLAAGGLTLFCLWTYPTDPLLPVETQLLRALDRSPQDAWLLHLEGRNLLLSGRGPWAVAGTRAALSLQPRRYAFLFSYVWALTTQGGATQEWMDRITTGIDLAEGSYRDKTCDGYLLKTLWRLAGGDKAEAARAYADALAQEAVRMPLLNRIETPYEHEVDERLHRIDTRQFQKVRELLSAWPSPARAILAQKMLRLVDSPRMRSEWLSLLNADNFASAQTALPLSGDTHRDAMAYQNLKEYGKSLQILDRLVSAYPKNAKLRSDRGVAYALSGRTEDAVKDLEAAIRIDPYHPAAYLTLGSILTGRKQYAKALDLYKTALEHDCFKIDPETCARIRDERDRLRRLSR